MQIETDRLRLREWRDSDLAPFAALNADPRVMEYFMSTVPPAQSEAMVDRIRAHFREHDYGLFAVERKSEGPGDFIGFVGLVQVDFEAAFTPAVEIGWRLAHAAWGYGYASEGARACLRLAFALLDLPEVVSFTSTLNLRSQAVMRRIGLRHDPAFDFDHPKVEAGHRIERHVFYRIEAKTWRAAQSATSAG